MPFLSIFDDFCLFSLEKGPNFFLRFQNFFSRKFDPKWFQIHLFELPNSFWLIMPYYLVMLKKSFFPIFPYNLGFSEIPPSNKLKKNIRVQFFALGNIPNHKIQALKIMKIYITVWYGGAWEPYLAPRLFS